MVGYIPERVRYVARPARSSFWSWDDGKKVDTGLQVYPVFPVDPDKPKTLETARSWASSRTSKSMSPPEIEEENKPFEIRILSLEYRSQGGRAYKVVFGRRVNYYVDLREDVLLDTILESGIKAGGVPNAKFLWAKVGAEMKLIREGSYLHDQMKVATAESKMKKIKKKDLKVGTVYRNRIDDDCLYLGERNVLVIKEEIKSGHGWRSELIGYKVKVEKRQVWLKTWRDTPDTDDFWKSWRIDYLKSKSVIEAVREVEIPDDWHQRVIKAVLKDLEETNHKKYSIRLDSLMSWAIALHHFDTTDTPMIDYEQYPFLNLLQGHIEII